MSKRFATLMLACALGAASAVTAGPGAGTVSAAGVLASPNVGLLANIPDAGSVGGRFVGRFYFTTTVTGLRIYDTTNPELPVLAGALPLPHWENEDVDVSASRKLVLISHDDMGSRSGTNGTLYVISWLNPRLPRLLSRYEYPGTYTVGGRAVGGPGHIVNCISDCARYAYVNGARDGSIQVIDLRDPAAPAIVASISAATNPAGRPNDVFKTGIIHDVSTDGAGTVWTVGSGGTSQMDVSNPLRPKVLRWITPADNKKANHFIHHNSLRLNRDTLLVTEEDYPAMCGEPSALDPAVANQGSFQTWRIDNRRTGSGAVRPLDEWETELGTYLDGNAAVTGSCSSHWFTFSGRKVVAVGWYDQGVRFLDVSNPRNIRQVGYWIRPTMGLGASGAYFVPGRDDLVYVTDYNRGLDILKIEAGGVGAPTVVAPIRTEWIRPRGTQPLFARPDPVFGFACRRPA
ncbi:MAG: LVIVD repeat-containing protein [Actinomycetota bacterium]